MPPNCVSDETFAAASDLSSASLHEAAGRLGALPARLKPLCPSMRLCGRALPVRCPPGDNLWIHRALAVATSGDVLVVECGSGDAYGYWGEIMATAAQTRSVAGLVITGGVRDSQALIAIGLPTFSTCICIRGTAKDPDGDGAVGLSVRVGDVNVNKGDLVFGDADGICVLRPDIAVKAVRDATKRDADEIEIIKKIKAGALTLDVYNL